VMTGFPKREAAARRQAVVGWCQYLRQGALVVVFTSTPALEPCINRIHETMKESAQ
jgi:hypothetical protein